MEEVKTEKEKEEEKKEPEKTPIEKVQEILKEYDFIKFDGKVFAVNHPELQVFLEPKILTMGDASARGRLLASYNGGLSNIDPETLSLNTFMATISVGFLNLKLDLSKVLDANLIDALYLAVKSYNGFFRTKPLGILL